VAVTRTTTFLFIHCKINKEGNSERERERVVNRVSQSEREHRTQTHAKRERIQTHVLQFVESSSLTRGVFFQLFAFPLSYELFGLMYRQKLISE
jgi:hypothetical protein